MTGAAFARPTGAAARLRAATAGAGASNAGGAGASNAGGAGASNAGGAGASNPASATPASTGASLAAASRFDLDGRSSLGSNHAHLGRRRGRRQGSPPPRQARRRPPDRPRAGGHRARGLYSETRAPCLAGAHARAVLAGGATLARDVHANSLALLDQVHLARRASLHLRALVLW